MTRRRRTLAVLIAVAGALLVPQAAQGAINNALGVPCTVQPDGVRYCTDAPRSTAPAWDGVPIDVNVAFPPEPAAGVDGNFPLVMLFHGYGGGKIGLSGMQRWLDRGYATFSMTTRGFRESCGSVASRAAAGAACDQGYVRLIDNRYEVRDAQEFAGQLADQGPGLIDPQRIGAIGGSYGGGMSMALAALKNRKVLPDYSLVPWTSPAGKPMQIAAAAPNIPWTDLAYSLVPNGKTLDYVADAPYRGPVGVEKQSLVEGLYLSGLSAPGYYAPPGSDPTADLTTWRARLDQGEPYGADAQAIIDEITQHHSSYYIDSSIEPAPLLMSSGFTDDLFPADETIRFYNRTKSLHPDADMALFFGDFGHPRSQSQKANENEARAALEAEWFNHYVKGQGSEPAGGVTAYVQTCPNDAPGAGPHTAPNWAQIAPGEVRFRAEGEQTIAPDSGTGGTFNPVSSNACTTVNTPSPDSGANYSLDPAPAEGFTLMGAVTVIAKYGVSTDTSQIAARLIDVAPDGSQTLVNRGLWRPQGGIKKEVFQLHPNGYRFAEGHVPKLELRASDAGGAPLANYGRPSNGQGPITVENLKMRMPVLERPGSLGGLVGAPAPKVLPEGYFLAPDFGELPRPTATLKGKIAANGARGTVKVNCPAAFVACHDGRIEAFALKGDKFAVAKGKFGKVPGGKKKKVTVKLTPRAQKALDRKGKLKVRTELRITEVANATRVQSSVVDRG